MRSHILLASLTGLAALGSSALAFAAPPSPQLTPSWLKPAPISKLPENVKPVEGKLSLHADYRDVRGNRVVLYLVNRTKEAVVLPAEGSNVYIKQETRRKDGGWERSQSHNYSWCGNSYHEVTIPPEHFILVGGWRSLQGKMQVVRYRLYGKDVVSNTGRGPIDPTEVEKAKSDLMTVAFGNIDLVKRVMFGKPESNRLQRTMAVGRLGELPRDESLPVLERLLKSVKLMQDLFPETVLSFIKVAPERFAPHARKFLVEGNAEQRAFLLQHPSIFAKVDDKAVREVLMKDLRDPKTLDFRLVASFLAERGQPGLENLLESIQDSEKYPEHLRIAARYERERSFGDKKLRITVESIGGYRRKPPPLPLIVKLTNTSKQTISFRYRAPSDILSLYVKIRGRFLEPDPGVVWFRPATVGRTHTVRLKPGETHELRMNVRDYFDLPKGTDYCYVSLSCSLPGVHQTPQLVENAASFSKPLQYP